MINPDQARKIAADAEKRLEATGTTVKAWVFRWRWVLIGGTGLLFVLALWVLR